MIQLYQGESLRPRPLRTASPFSSSQFYLTNHTHMLRSIEEEKERRNTSWKLDGKSADIRQISRSFFLTIDPICDAVLIVTRETFTKDYLRSAYYLHTLIEQLCIIIWLLSLLVNGSSPSYLNTQYANRFICEVENIFSMYDLSFAFFNWMGRNLF